MRTHTSPVQIRALQERRTPLRVFTIGRTYRNDFDATHTPMFHQIEGLVIEPDINFGHLKGCVLEFCEKFFEIKLPTFRFRPSYFPFTEPSAEVDLPFHKKNGKIILGSGDNWLEIMGCGMVHPEVLRMAGIDASKNQGFAFGMGLEHLTSLKYGIPDLRGYFEGNKRWSDSFGCSPFC